jgi:CBS domain containing-hemolysin-like protein
MSDPDSSLTGQGPDHRASFWKTLKNRIYGKGEKNLRESLEGAIEAHATQNPGDIVQEETKSMMLNIIEFAKLRVDDVMVPRVDIVAIDEASGMAEVLQKFIDANHSRMPVFRESLDGISGMVHVKDFMRWMTAKGAKKRKAAKGEKQVSIGGLSISATELATPMKQSGLHREVLFVPPSMPATDLLVKMQASHIHLAIVIDEYGGTDGLVSIEDLVEVIVGDIADEHDTDEDSLFKDNGDGTFTADGRLDLSRLELLVKIDLFTDEEEEADTLAGIVFELAGRVPTRGEIIRHASGLEFEILESDPRRVKRVKINTKNVVKPADESTAMDASG